MNPRGLDSASFGAGSASSLTDLFETDALLDAVGARAPARSAAAEPPEIQLLRALVASVDSDLRTDLEADVDPIAVAALAAGFELVGSTEPDAAAARAVAGSSWHHSLRIRVAGTSRLQLVGGTTGRRLRRYRPYRLVAVVAGLAIALGGGSLAAAATTDPTNAWGPLRPLAGALHPGWQADFFAAKRDAIMRTLDRATVESQSGDRVAAAVTYGTAKQQARDLPKGPDAGLRAKFDAVAAQLGLTQGGRTSTAAPSPVVDPTVGAVGGGTTATTGDSTDPSGVTPVGSAPPPNTGDPSTTPGSTSGASTDPSTPSDGATTGSTPDPAAPPAATSPAPSPVPTDPGSGTGSGSGSGSISGSTSGSVSGSVDGSTSGSISGSTGSGGSTSSTGSTGSAGSTGSTGSSVTGQSSNGSTLVGEPSKSNGSTDSAGSAGSTSSTDTAADPGSGSAAAPSAPSDAGSSSGGTAASGSAAGAASSTASAAEPAEASAPTA
jgi:hypothetical protein